MSREPLPIHTAAIALVRRGRHVLLVESRYPNIPEPLRFLPGGMLEAGERLDEGLVREVREETGLEVGGSLIIAAVIWLQTSDGNPPWVTFVVEPETCVGDPAPDDPDGSTVGAGFVPVDDAIGALRATPWGLGEPVARRLLGAPAGAIWHYRWNAASPWLGTGPAELVSGPVDAVTP